MFDTTPRNGYEGSIENTTDDARVTMDDDRIHVGGVLFDGGTQCYIVGLDRNDNRIELEDPTTEETYWTHVEFLTDMGGRIRVEDCL